MNVQMTQHDGDATVLAVEGRLDGSTFEGLIAAAREAKDGGAAHLLLDLSGCEFMSSAGLMALHSMVLIARGQQPLDTEHGWGAFRQMDADKQVSESAAESQAPLPLIGASDKIRQTLEMTGMLAQFALFDSVDAALGASAS